MAAVRFKAAEPVVDDADNSVATAARAAMKFAKGDIDKAAARLEAQVRSNPALRDALTDPLLANACRAAVQLEMRAGRRTVWKQAKKPKASEPAADAKKQAARVVRLAAGTLLMFPLPGGKLLGEATRAEIAAAADYYSKIAADTGTKARWLQLIGQSVPEGKKVGDVLTDARLRELQREAQADGEE